MGQRVYVARESVVAPIALLTVEGIDPGCHQSGVKSVVVTRSAVAILETQTQVCSISILNTYLVNGGLFFGHFSAIKTKSSWQNLEFFDNFLEFFRKKLEFFQIP